MLIGKQLSFARSRYIQNLARSTSACNRVQLFSTEDKSGNPELTKELQGHLRSLGIYNDNIVHNPSVAQLYEYAMRPEHLWSPDRAVAPSTISETGALSVSSGKNTGRVPKNKRVVLDDMTRDLVHWGEINIPASPESYVADKQRAIDFMNYRKRLFIIDGYAGWDPKYRKLIRTICCRPYHAMFMKQMLIRDNVKNLDENFSRSGPDFTLLNSGEFVSDYHIEDIGSQTTVNVNFTTKELVVLGTSYAGEMKKGVFGIMHYYMPKEGQLSMHASCNVGQEDDATILFGLSGTGKTTLSSDPKRRLVGDDEHVWTDEGVFNIEGGCYAKCDSLSQEKEPDIYNAIKFGALMENVCYHGDKDRPRTIDYDNVSLTENTRVCYPLEHIQNAKIPAISGHPKNIIFLTCDAYGVMPPVSKLTPEQAMYHFISGYTSKVAGTEMGILEPVPTFSACFGEAFLPIHPYKYAEMLAEKCKKHDAKVWLINTGWVRGKYGVGHRMSLTQTRAIIDSIHDGSLNMTECDYMRRFGLQIPKECSGVDTEILRPINCWENKEEYKQQAKKLAEKFAKNFERYAEGVPKDVVAKGGPDMSF